MKKLKNVLTVLCIIIFCVTITEITVKANNDFELLELDNENMEEEKSDTELFDEDLIKQTIEEDEEEDLGWIQEEKNGIYKRLF